MKKSTLIISLIINILLPAYAMPNCYDRLLNGHSDSSIKQIKITENFINSTLQIRAEHYVNKMLLKYSCRQKLKSIQCGEAIKGNHLTEICYIVSEWGYFIVSKDFMENLNIIFSRWD